MKTRSWILLFGAIAAVLLGMWLILLTPGEAERVAQIRQNGKLIRAVDLSEDQVFTVTWGDAANVIRVSDGKICVEEATCPDQYCVKRGAHNSGTPIVCLPNRLVISFGGSPEIDAIAG